MIVHKSSRKLGNFVLLGIAPNLLHSSRMIKDLDINCFVE